MAEYDNGLVDKLKEKLYKRGTFKADLSRAPFSQDRSDIKSDWEHNEDNMSGGVLHPTFLKKFFIFALVFFLLAIAASAYVILSGSNVVSTDNLEISLKGPTAIKAGDDLSLGITVLNHNTINLEAVDLIIAFPPGTRDAVNKEKEMPYFRKNLGDIKSGEVINQNIKAVLFGEAGTNQEIKISLEYRTSGSNAIFKASKVYKVLLSAAPLNVNLTAPEELRAGNTIDFSIDISADTPDPLTNVLVKVDYPSGFQFKKSTPNPVFGNNVWSLGSVSGGNKRTIKVSGILMGQDNEKKFFRVTAGTAATDKESEIGVPYGGSSAIVLMRSSFINFATTLSGNPSTEIISDPGKMIRGGINWSNNLPDRLINARVKVEISGNSLDQSSVSPGNGFYSSLDNTITWMRQHESSLAIIEPGASSQVNFDFNTLSYTKLASLGVHNPYVTIKYNFQATRVIDGNPGETVETSATKTVKLNTHFALIGRGLYSAGPFVNLGPVPPRVNQETTYTITWSVINSSNAVDDASVVATLPSNTTFLGNVSPSGSDIRYDSTTGQIRWNIGRVEVGSGDSPAKEASFQIRLIPSAPQVDQTLPLITDATLSGRDLFTGERLSDTLTTIDTRIYTDPQFNDSWSKVAP